MSKILEKLGVYDLLVLLFAGIIALSATIFIDKTVLAQKILKDVIVEETFPILLSSYLVGLVLNEVSSLLYVYVFNKNNRLVKSAVRVNRVWQPVLEQSEKRVIKNMLSQIPELSKEGRIGRKICWPLAYEYCKVRMRAEDLTRNERDQYTAGISRSLALYCAILTVLLTIYSILTHTNENWIYILISLLLMLLFHHRYVRFTYMRYIRTFRSYCYRENKGQANDAGVQETAERINARESSGTV